MQTPPTDPVPAVEAAYHQHFETVGARASISFVGVETIEVLRYEWHGPEGRPGGYSYLSLGMSRYPMTDPTAAVVQSDREPRAELLISTIGRPDELWRRLAVLAAGPAVESAVYRNGSRIDLGEPWCAGSRCTGAIVTEGPLQSVPVLGLPAIDILLLLPAHPVELAWSRVHGTDALAERWRRERTELRDLFRDPVDLQG
jgi:hypothetical protein